MTNRSTRIRSGKKPRLRLLDLAFEQSSPSATETEESGKRPHGGYKGNQLNLYLNKVVNLYRIYYIYNQYNNLFNTHQNTSYKISFPWII